MIRKKWKLTDLDFRKAREYIPSQNPEISLRFVLPIPNWMDQSEPAVSHHQIKQVEKKSGLQWCYLFSNPKDQAQQAVKIDGSAAIIFMGVDTKKSEELNKLITECLSGGELTPDKLTIILDRSYEELGIVDRFNKSLGSIDQFFHPYEVKGHLGSFLPRPNKSSAIYIPGAGEFLDGPTATPQKFENGAFINFPGMELKNIFLANVDGKARLVQADVFRRDRTHPDGKEIKLECIPAQ